MITGIHPRKLFPLLVMLLALAGMTLSVIGEAFSHGVADLSAIPAVDHYDHLHNDEFHGHDAHSHDADENQNASLHHDSGNHTHESVDRLTIPLASRPLMSFRQTTPYAGDSPRNFRYRLERPPKAFLIV